MYKGIVKVYHEADSVDEPVARGYGGDVRSFSEAKKNKRPNGMLLEVTVTAPTQESLVKKISAMLATLDDDE